MLGKTAIHRLMSALSYASIMHKGQVRKDGTATPYINHPLEVVHLLTTAGVNDVETLMAAALHDVVEDCGVTLNNLLLAFNSPLVVEIVDSLSDDKALPKADRKRLCIEHAPTLLPQAKLIKVADLSCNCTDILAKLPIGWSIERGTQYFEWAQQVVSAIGSIDNVYLTENFRIIYSMKDRIGHN